ncbi:MAG: GNAT family N-acetyltransferase [Nocardioidaceae bacterium]
MPSSPDATLRSLRTASFSDLDPRTAYLLWQLRVGVFVVEQGCAYAELDGLDLDETTRHLWVEDDGIPVAYLRILVEPDDTRRIGRVCTAAHVRRQGLAARLMDQAMRDVGDRRCVLNAQAYLAGWYTRWGFQVVGPEFLDDGIPHLPMALDGTRA